MYEACRILLPVVTGARNTHVCSCATSSEGAAYSPNRLPASTATQSGPICFSIMIQEEPARQPETPTLSCARLGHIHLMLAPNIACLYTRPSFLSLRETLAYPGCALFDLHVSRCMFLVSLQSYSTVSQRLPAMRLFIARHGVPPQLSLPTLSMLVLPLKGHRPTDNRDGTPYPT